MNKRARRLWLGDWQRGDETEQGDTIRILPDEEPEPTPAADPAAGQRRRNTQRAVASAVAIAAICAFIFAVTSGGDDKRLTSATPQTPPAQTPQVQPQVPPSQVPPQANAPPGFGGADLTGAAAEKAAKAALAKFPGDIERVTAGPGGGGYVVHVIQPDGNEVHVIVSDEFKVLGSDSRVGPPPQSGSTNSS